MNETETETAGASCGTVLAGETLTGGQTANVH
jgi:hypothetical protein